MAVEQPDTTEGDTEGDVADDRSDDVGDEAAPLVLLFDTYPHGFYGAQRTVLELALAGTGGPASFRSLALLLDEGPAADRLRAAGVTTEVVPVRFGSHRLRPGRLSRIVPGLGVALYSVRMSRTIRRWGVDVVYCSNTRSVITIGPAARLARRPVVWYVQIQNTLGWADRMAARLATHVVVLAPSTDRLLDRRVRRIARDRIHTIALGAPPSDGTHQQQLVSDGVLRITLVGAINARKGHHVLLDALERLPHDARVEVRFVGDAAPDDREYERTLRLRVERSGLADRIEFTGWTDHVDRILAETDVLVLPSEREGLPRVVMEAMAAGVAVIATDVGAVCDLVVDGVTGRLLATADAEILADAISDLARDPERVQAMGRAGRDHLSRSFSAERFRQEFTELFRAAARG